MSNNSPMKNVAFIERPLGWSEDIYCYAYSSDNPAICNATWPGEKMESSPDKRIYSLLIKIPNPMIIFTDGREHYPGKVQNGYKLKGSMILRSGKWSVYEKKQEDCRFEFKKKITGISDTPVNVRNIPAESAVLSSIYSGNVTLTRCLGGGGEGSIYKTNTPYIAKIYKQGKLTQRNKKKLELMISKKISYEGICYPVDLLYYGGEFVGFLMPEAKGEILQISVFQPMVMKEKHPNWKKQDLVDLSLTILKKIKYLHDRNIILGDINPQNILVVSPTEVYFVDTDSYQIEDFPCPVGTVYFTAPELQGKPFKGYLRTIGNENFAIATLLFMLMLPGKAPYARVGGGAPMENIKQMYFPYSFKEYPEDTPPGFWRFCWSHLTFKLKVAFYQTFMKGEKYSRESNRLNVDAWIDLFEEYRYLLQSGKMEEQDEMANDIFPTRLKRNNKYNYKNCSICRNEFPEQKLKRGLCCECRNQVYKTVKCVDCKAYFTITNGEHQFFVSRQWNDPTRCKSCRERRKNNR